jgi:hypothetical protein
MKARLASLFLGTLLAAASAAVAQAPPAAPAELLLPPQYEVEVLIFAFRELDPTEERFDQELNGFEGDATAFREAPVFDDLRFGAAAPQPGALDTTVPQPGVLEPVDPLAARRAEVLRTRPLRPEELKLGAEYRKLQAVAAYVPLVHTGWVQPGLPEADAQPFDLKVLGTLNPSGTIRVHLSARNFLHITLDLTYQGSATGAPLAANVANDGLDELVLPPRYHLKTTRTVRSGELHYFDHPAFGVLVRITPVARQDAQGRRPAA